MILKAIILADAWIIDDSGGKPYREVEGLGSSCYIHYLDFLIECEIKKFLHNMIELTGHSMNTMCKPKWYVL